MLSRKLTKDDCEYWKKNPKKNPISKYTLKENSKLLKQIEKQCNTILQQQPEPSPQKELPIVPGAISPSSLTESAKSNSAKSHSSGKAAKAKVSESFELYYPDVDDPQFAAKIASLYEFNIHQIPAYPVINSAEDFKKVADKLCGQFEKSYYQHFISQYISDRTPYKSILLYHGVGVGKTCSAITLAESFLIPHNMYDEPKIWVILPHALKANFREQIFTIDGLPYEMLANQCTGDTYIKLLNITKDSLENKDKAKQAIKRLINSRYKIFTYDAFTKFIEAEYKNKIIKDKIIIIDEVHNIRSTDKDDKLVYSVLKEVLATGINNRLVLLSATPMYNEPSDILDLLYLLLINDHRSQLIEEYKNVFESQHIKMNDDVLQLIRKLSQTYISYLKGKNPFTFAVKLSPKHSGIPVIEDVPKTDPFGKPVSDAETHWIQRIDEGVVASKLGERQIEHINMLQDLNENNIFNNLQPMNIVYDTDIGEKGFYTFFSKARDTDPLCVRYNKSYMNALMPDEEHLGKYSGKFLNICNFIKKARGIVVIYSRYRWSGILPMAVCLEHMGYVREGTNNILENADVISDYARQRPKYCILSSENRDIMGSTTIDGLVKTINDPRNINGELIKVILITPVASEGLSFYNAREIHLIEPWYHFNRAVQIIGRGIRNCRHQQLPLEEKNVSVFMHASVHSVHSVYDSNDKESIDLHAYRVSTRKYIQSNAIDKIIANNALDCLLMKNINYFPRELFKISKFSIKTSQGVVIDYAYGDDVSDEPKCNAHIAKINKSGFRKDTFSHFLPNVRAMLRNLIIQRVRDGIYYIPHSEIMQSMDYNHRIIYEGIRTSIYPNVLLDGYTIVPHEEGLHIITIKPTVQNKIVVSADDIKKDNDVKPVKIPVIKVNRNDRNAATFALYSSLDDKTFDELAKNILESEELDETLAYIGSCLAEQGVLIRKNELRTFRTANMLDYIGYVNIFNLKDDFDVILYNYNEKKYRDANENERQEIKRNRRRFPDIPADMSRELMPWGILMPKQIKNKPDIINTFKIYTTGESVGKKTGIECTSLKKDEHDTIFKELNVGDANGTKIQNCTMIAHRLMSNNRLTMMPLYKPNL